MDYESDNPKNVLGGAVPVEDDTDSASEDIGRVLGSQIYIYNSPDDIPPLPPKGVNDVFIDINLGKVFQWDGSEWQYKFPIPNDSRIADIVDEMTALGARLADEESARVAAESARVDAESARVQAEQARSTSEGERASAEQARVSAETERANAESVRESSEGNRQRNESSRVQDESARQTTEANRATAESARATAESARAAAESARIESESARAASESERKEAEQSRVSGESSRATAEEQRATAESARVSAEQARQTNESARQTQETSRQGAESSRATAEQSRSQSEVGRQVAESNRVDAENLRAQAESARAANDTLWNEHEATRQSNEAQRVLAEQARVEAEARRQEELDSKITYGSKWYDGSGGVGYADEAKSVETRLGMVSQTPFSHEKAGGESDIETGLHKLNKLVGVTLVRNQWFTSSRSFANKGVSFSCSGQKVTLSGTSDSSGNVYIDDVDVKGGDTYFIYTNYSGFILAQAYSGSTFVANVIGNANKGIVTLGANITTILLYLYLDEGTVYNKTFDVAFINLTKRYGSNEVANAIIGTGTSEEKVARLLAFDPNILKDIQLDEGTLVPSKSAKLLSTGFNIWDEQTEIGGIDYSTGQNSQDNTRLRSANYAEVTPNTTYYQNYLSDRSRSIDVFYYDSEKRFIGHEESFTVDTAGLFTTPSNCRYIRFIVNSSYGTTYNHDICVNISNASMNGTYMPSEKHPYDLPNEELNGILDVVDGKVVADGDERYPDGTGKTKYALVELSTLPWQKEDASTNLPSGHTFSVRVSNFQIVRRLLTAIESRYISSASSANTQGVLYYGHDYYALIYADENISTVQELVASFGEKDMLYKLKEPVDVESIPFTENIYANRMGTLRFLDENGNTIPGLQGNEIFYKANIIGFAESLYERTEGDANAIALDGDVDEAVEETKEWVGETLGDYSTVSYVDGLHSECLSTIDEKVSKVDGKADLALDLISDICYNEHSSTVVTDSSVAYQKEVPAKSLKYASMASFGGMCQKVNQLVPNGDMSNSAGWSAQYFGGTITFSDGVATVVRTGGTCDISRLLNSEIPSGHVVLFAARLKTADSNNVVFGGNNDLSTNQIATTTAFSTICAIKTLTNNLLRIYLACKSDGADTRMDVDWYATADLTTIWPTDTPTSTSDPRIQRLMSYLSSHPEYNAGSIITAPVTKVVSKGFNLWDEETVVTAGHLESKNFCECYPNTDYYVCGPTISPQLLGNGFMFYDKNKNLIKTAYSQAGATAKSPENARYFKIGVSGNYGTTYNHDICINVSNASLNGTYMPYRAPIEYPIPAEVRALEGYGYGLSAECCNEVSYEGKSYGKKVVRVDLGTLEWNKHTDAGHEKFFTNSLKGIIKNAASASTKANITCAKYTASTANNIYSHSNDGIIAVETNGQVSVYDTTYMDGSADAFKAAMSGVYLYFELATPVETDISEYIDDGFIEVQGGGSLVFENEDEVAVPSVVTYLVEETTDE